MPPIDSNFLKLLKKEYNEYSNFIETGTYLGDTICLMKDYFDNVYTIEIKEQFYDYCRNKYRGTKINFLLGDSSDVLKSILPGIQGKSIIFLDGHWSAGDTGRGKKDCPLYEELESIIKYHSKECLIIIDDVRLFGMGPNKGNEICNWEDISISNVLEIVKDRLMEKYFLPSQLDKEDRLILHLK